MKKNIVRITENQLRQIVNESVTRILREGLGEEELGVEESHVIPMDFVMRNHNSINLGDHKLIYDMIGRRDGNSEHTTLYRQKVTVVTSDGRKEAQIYTQRGDEYCSYKMHDVYVNVCKRMGIQPAELGWYD
jgi:hypothetical protein